jgi:hypothetical protein
MSESVIDFGSVVPGSTVRAVKKDDGKYYMPRRDIIMAVCSKNASDASTVWTRDLTDDDKKELLTFCRKHTFQGSGYGETDVLNLDGAILLTMILPGKFARTVRIKAANLLKNWIHENTDDPLLREMAAETDQSNALETKKRRERDDLVLDLQLEERRISLKRQAVELHEKEAEIPFRVHEHAMQIYQSLCPNNKIDERARIMFKDRLLNLIVKPSAQITNGVDENPDGSPMSVSDLVVKAGKVFGPGDMIKIGANAAMRFRERYGEDKDPSKHEQYIGGRKCLVNHYVLKDHDLVVAAIESFVKGK